MELLPLIYEIRGGVSELRIEKADGAQAAAGETIAFVATLARQFADRVAGTGCRVLDTRKTTPGLRRLEKMAAAAGGVSQAVGQASGLSMPIEIEVRTLAELREALEAGAQHLLLDNLTPAQAVEWIREIAGRATVAHSDDADHFGACQE